MEMADPRSDSVQSITAQNRLNGKVERNMKDLVLCAGFQGLDESDVIIHVLEHVDAQQSTEGFIEFKQVALDVVNTVAFARRRQLERLL